MQKCYKMNSASVYVALQCYKRTKWINLYTQYYNVRRCSRVGGLRMVIDYIYAHLN